MKSEGGPARDVFSKREDDVARSPWFGIEVERESHGGGHVSEVLSEDVEMPLALGKSGERSFRC